MEITDHKNFHFGLFCFPNQPLITNKLLQKFAVFLNHPLDLPQCTLYTQNIQNWTCIWIFEWLIHNPEVLKCKKIYIKTKLNCRMSMQCNNSTSSYSLILQKNVKLNDNLTTTFVLRFNNNIHLLLTFSITCLQPSSFKRISIDGKDQMKGLYLGVRVKQFNSKKNMSNISNMRKSNSLIWLGILK